MRRHSRFSRFATPVDPAHYAATVGAPHLAAARLQPSYSARFECWMDLIFVHAGRVALVPFVQLDGPMLLVEESSPFLWPSWVPLDDTTVDGIEAMVAPWLRSLAMFEATDSESFRFFSDDPSVRALIEAARAARFLGAASIESVLTDASPYTYAQRFAKGRRVGIRGDDAASGAAMLATIARAVRADLGSPERNALAARWFDVDIYGEHDASAYDVTIGEQFGETSAVSIATGENASAGVRVVFARPAFASVACSFDPNDSAPARTFEVRAPGLPLRQTRIGSAPVIGGSTGRIGIVVRDDGLRVPEADIDEAQTLVAALCAQGFDASLVVASAARAQGHDLLHLIGHRHVAQFDTILAQAREAHVPIVVSPGLDDFSREAVWGAGIVQLLTTTMWDDGYRAMLESHLVSRRLQTTDGAPRGTIPFDEKRVRTMLQQAGAAIFTSDAEEAYARATFGFTGFSRRVPALLAGEPPAEPLAALCGIDEYVLIHAAAEPRANSVAVLRAAATASLPCVVVGTVENGDYYQNAFAFAGPQAVWLPQESLSPAQLAGLYAGARVYADLSWTGYGAGRIARAAGYGCALVLSSALPARENWPGIAETADPADFAALPAVLRRAWDRALAIGPLVAGRTAETCDPLASLKAILGAYAEAAGVRS